MLKTYTGICKECEYEIVLHSDSGQSQVRTECPNCKKNINVEEKA